MVIMKGFTMSMCLLAVVLLFQGVYGGGVHVESIACYSKSSPCFLKQLKCPKECPSKNPTHPKAKACYLNCNSPICNPECKNKKPNCNGPGAACHDPRFIGGDGVVFYFHGKSNHHFSLVSDPNLQINARFIGLRPPGRHRDFTWIQAIGILFDSHTFSVEATMAEKWDDEVDHLKFSNNGDELAMAEGYPSRWESSANGITVERTSAKNSALISLPGVAEISINVVPVTKEDDRIHSYHIPDDDCFAHLEVQFRFYGLTAKVEGVLGRTYQPDFVNPAKPGVAMAVLGGEDKYRTSSLLAADCAFCVFLSVEDLNEEEILLVEPAQSIMNCAGGGSNTGNGIVCRK
ncbi:Late embryogenesis abundant protein-like protein [Perilla frutescens var. frutescens]|nr:Late embryogenesis abundant protein-like protein [Perilla frutescens var. frutescens]